MVESNGRRPLSYDSRSCHKAHHAPDVDTATEWRRVIRRRRPRCMIDPWTIEDIFLSCSEPKQNVVEPSLVSVGTATMIQCRRCRWWCVQDVRLQDCYAQVTPGLAECCESACWRVLCKCMLDIRCSVLRGWSCAITKSFEFWLEKMGLILKKGGGRPPRGCWSFLGC